jgi:hypothetical protein
MLDRKNEVDSLLGIMEQRYQNGAEIHLADVVSYSGQSGRVVFVADRREYSETYPESDWPPSRYPTGFMIEFTNGARLLLDSSDEDLELVSRKTD